MQLLNPHYRQKSILKEIREKADLTQLEVAKKAKISIRAYKMYESGERKPKSDVAIRIADALGVKSYKEFKEIFRQGR